MTHRSINIFSLILISGFIILFAVAGWPFWPVLLIVFGYIITMLILSTNVQFNFFVKAYSSNPNYQKKAVALSFDDGPVENTLKILEILDRYDAKAVFFCIGKNIEKNPDIFKEIIKRGHIVGNHTYSHTRIMGFVSSKRFYEEINDCNSIAEKTAGIKMNLFRPPFGIINPKTKRALEKSGHKVIGWNVRPYDAITKSPEIILERITKRMKSGDLILLHDNMDKTAPILEQLLVILKQQHFKIVRPDKLFNIDAYS